MGSRQLGTARSIAAAVGASMCLGCSGSDGGAIDGCEPLELTDVDVLPDGEFEIVTVDRFELLDAVVEDTEFDEFPPTRVFVPVGSPDDGDERIEVALVLTAGFETEVADDLAERSPTRIEVAGVDFDRIVEGERQATYYGEIDGRGIAVSTFGVDRSMLESFVAQLAVRDGLVRFDGDASPPGWISLGTFEHRISFLAAATGGSAPACGVRVGYDADAIRQSDQTSSVGDFELALSVWPVETENPMETARYALDGERRVTVGLADGREVAGYTNDVDDEFFDWIMWADGGRWTAISTVDAPPDLEFQRLPGLLRSPTSGEVSVMEDLLDE
ncbi:MAG: hypothetical protein AAGF91_02365 [Actinomycetota bacterium]